MTTALSKSLKTPTQPPTNKRKPRNAPRKIANVFKETVNFVIICPIFESSGNLVYQASANDFDINLNRYDLQESGNVMFK